MEKTANIKNKEINEEIETLVRIVGFDIPGNKKVFVGLTRIKGVSWAVSNAICVRLNISKDKRIHELTKEEILKISDFIKDLKIPEYLKNRRFDPETGETKHLHGTDLDMRKDFDIKRLIKMKSYRGSRHASGLPSRGQRTRSNFRKRANKRTVGVKRKKK